MTLPSPWALSRGTGLAPSAVARDVLRPVLEALAADVELVVLAEPFFAREEEARRRRARVGGRSAGRRRPLALLLVFSDAGPALGRGLGELPVDAIGIDFHATRLEDVPAGLGKTMLAGVRQRA